MSSTIERELGIRPSPPRAAAKEPPPVHGVIRDSLREFAGFAGRLMLLLLSIEPLILAAIAPLSALLLTLPAVVPDESIIADTVSRTRC